MKTLKNLDNYLLVSVLWFVSLVALFGVSHVVNNVIYLIGSKQPIINGDAFVLVFMASFFNMILSLYLHSKRAY